MKMIEIIKQNLLSYNIFEKNEYFDKYSQLLYDNQDTPREKYRTQRHHIIPQCYYKYNDIEIDSSSNNLVNLLHKDHLLAHYYLSKCISDVKVRNAQLFALRKLIGKSYDEESILRMLPDYQVLKEETSKLIGDLHRGMHVSEASRKLMSEQRKGRKAWNEGIRGVIKDSLETQEKKRICQIRIWEEHKNDINFRTRGGYTFSDEGRLIHKNAILNKKVYHSLITQEERYFGDDDIIPDEYVIGRNPEHILANSLAHKGIRYDDKVYEKIAQAHRGRHYYTNGEKIVKVYECPPGYWPCGVGKNKGRKYYNNSYIEKLCFPDNVPEGFTLGKLKNKKEDK